MKPGRSGRDVEHWKDPLFRFAQRVSAESSDFSIAYERDTPGRLSAQRCARRRALRSSHAWKPWGESSLTQPDSKAIARERLPRPVRAEAKADVGCGGCSPRPPRFAGPGRGAIASRSSPRAPARCGLRLVGPLIPRSITGGAVTCLPPRRRPHLAACPRIIRRGLKAGAPGCTAWVMSRSRGRALPAEGRLMRLLCCPRVVRGSATAGELPRASPATWPAPSPGARRGRASPGLVRCRPADGCLVTTGRLSGVFIVLRTIIPVRGFAARRKESSKSRRRWGVSIVVTEQLHNLPGGQAFGPRGARWSASTPSRTLPGVMKRSPSFAGLQPTTDSSASGCGGMLLGTLAVAGGAGALRTSLVLAAAVCSDSQSVALAPPAPVSWARAADRLFEVLDAEPDSTRAARRRRWWVASTCRTSASPTRRAEACGA